MRAIRFLTGQPPYNATEVAGFPDAVAAKYVKAGVATFDVDGDAEVESRDPEPADRDPTEPSAPGTEPGTGADDSGTDTDPNQLPAELPGRDALYAAGFETLEAVEAIEDYDEITGIGQATETKILEYLAKLE